jgi:putative ABC transport system permease protein
LEDRIKAVPGVAGSRAFVSHTIQREHEGKPLRIVVQGLAWPEDKGDWLPIVAGRPLRAAHYEMVADRILGLGVGEKVVLGKDTYTVVGLTAGMIGQSGDGLAFFTARDALNIQFDLRGEAVRLEKAARRARVAQSFDTTNPFLTEKSQGESASLPGIPRPMISAVLASVRPGTDAESVKRIISGWPDVTVYSTEEQKELLLKGTVDRARRQLGLFRALLIIISAIIMALIIYTLTLDKVHDIAMLKLMGARNRVILSLILQQALILGFFGYILAYYIGTWIFPNFPRRVIVVQEDLISLGGIVLVISVVSSLLGIWKAMKVQPNEVLS